MDNTLKINYNLTYVTNNYPRLAYDQCKLTVDFNRTRSCVIYKNDDPHYQLTKTFLFTLTSSFRNSQFLPTDSFTETFEVDHYASVVPAAPQNLLVSDITTDSALLSWELPKKYFSRSIPLDLELEIKSQYDQIWRKVTTKSFSSHRLEHLEHPFALYEVRLRIKTEAAPDKDEMWTPYVENTFQTLGRIPDRPPISTVGAFYISDYGNLTLYWQQLEEAESNGPNLRYTFSEIKENNLLV